MASASEKPDSGLKLDDSGSDSKGHAQELDNVEAAPHALTEEEGHKKKKFEAPEFIRIMTPEQREEIEGNLRRKIDARLMPMIVIMYIMNYLDRVSYNLKLIATRY
jgi:tRNA uridine 5-carbamoylmethylation protein Kti12